MIVIVIPAKGFSTRLPNKNMALINGRPMLSYAIKQALDSQIADSVYISTDSDVIEEYCAESVLQIIRRPLSLGGETPLIDVYRHAIKSIDNEDNLDILVGLQPDHPDRNVSIDETIEILRREQADRLISKEQNGTKNGAHCLLTKHYIDTGVSRKDVAIVDSCTNVHTADDLALAAKRLAARSAELQ